MTTAEKRHPITAQVVATTTAVGAALGLLAAGATDPNRADITPVAVSREVEPMSMSTLPEPPTAPVNFDPLRALIEHRPHTVRPVDAPVSSTFGARWGTVHRGMDFAGQMHAPIKAVTDGVVIEAGPATGFGLWVRVQQDDGTVGVYGHMQDILVHVGQPVRAGDVIATVGSRGQSTGPHLHYEVHLPNNAAVDPMPWLSARGVDASH
ncbi:M23 family metallopeptidase [Nocardia paucivorans]|uniref:M23 family metallopeptidase n=1 Tax=Nocardia paucivorans TaxID=114259 RepID=UPI001FDF0290|nr:M23 family metallopeptidase [Nocardia paucivorans]